MKKMLPISVIFLMLCIPIISAQQQLILEEVESDSTGSEVSAMIMAPSIELLEFDGKDGPYIINDTLYRVTADNSLVKEDQYNRDSILVQVDNGDNDQFYVSIDPNYEVDDSTYELPKKMLVISDIEGQYDAFYSFLLTNNVIDKNHDWIFGDGHLVLVGDFVDRGENVTAVLWLIYKLERQARLKKGRVHYILGNHEVLNFQGDHRYNKDKYIAVAQHISKKPNKTEAVKYVYSSRSELGRWLATKPVIVKIGEYLFVHAGLSTEILQYALTLDEINAKVRLTYHQEAYKKDSIATFLYGDKGPFWYRGMVTGGINYRKMEKEQLDSILAYYSSEKVVVGHTIVDSISTAYQGGVIRIDVPHGHNKFTGRTKGLLIEDGHEYIVDDMGNKTALKE